jgi:hypothetical protein
MNSELVSVVAQALPSAVKKAEDAFATFVVEVPREHSLEQALHPRYCGASPKIQKEARPGSVVLLRAVDHRFLAELYVESTTDLKDAGALIYRVLRIVDLAACERLAFDWSTSVTFTDAGGKAEVRLDDKIIRGDFESMAQAKAWVAAKCTVAQEDKAA